MNVIDLLQREQEKPEVPVLRPGDTVRVHVRVVEGTRERIQAFEGVIIAIGGKTGTATSFTVRRISHGVGVERTFLVHSPRLDRIEVLRHGHVRRGKLYYLRDKVGKRARIRERRDPIGGSATVIRSQGAPELVDDQVVTEVAIDEVATDEVQQAPEATVSTTDDVAAEAPAEEPVAAARSEKGGDPAE